MKNLKLRITESFVVLVTVALTVAGCGGKSASSPQGGVIEIRKIGNLEYGLLDAVGLQSTETAIAGTGTVVFRNPLPEEDNHFSVNTQLQPGGKLTIVTNSDAKLNSGIQLTIARNSNGSIAAEMKTAEETKDLGAFFAHIDSARAFTFDFEVHPHGHLMLMIAGTTNEVNFVTRPIGKFWGLKLDKSAVSALAISAVQEE